MATSDCFVSVVAPLSNVSSFIETFVSEVMLTLQKNYANYELVLVDDGSTDDTVQKVSVLLKAYDCVRFIRLSRRFGQEVAISAGLDSAIGDFVVVMLPEMDPPALIPEFVQRSRVGSGVVFGVRRSRENESWLYRVGTELFYAYSKNVLEINLPKNSTQFRVLSRQAVNAITQIKDRNRYLRIFSGIIGYSHESIVYDPIYRSEKSSHRSVLESINLALDIIITNSRHPLRIASGLGLFASGLNLLYMLYALVINLVKKNVVEGWTTTAIQSSAMFFFLFLILTVISEYVGRILDEIKDRPLYFILEERNSSVMLADQNRRNIVTDSEQLKV